MKKRGVYAFDFRSLGFRKEFQSSVNYRFDPILDRCDIWTP